MFSLQIGKTESDKFTPLVSIELKTKGQARIINNAAVASGYTVKTQMVSETVDFSIKPRKTKNGNQSNQNKK